MDITTVIALFSLLGLLLVGGGLAWYYFMPQAGGGGRMGNTAHGLVSRESAMRRTDTPDLAGAELERLRSKHRVVKKGKVVPTRAEKFFHAGMFTEADQREYQRLQTIAPVVAAVVLGFLASNMGAVWALVGVVLGVAIGWQLPNSILDRRIISRNEDITFYLPLVIEQIVIGVSSSLDIGPCLQRVVAMAEERDSHNPVTELLRHAQYLMKSGVSLEEALTEVGKLSGSTELKHSFMSLAQVARHGGEITKQLQELADAVASQRETKIEAKIKKLELEATGPVGLVFVGFLLLLLMEFGWQVLQAFM